jgi:hypothetical protein
MKGDRQPAALNWKSSVSYHPETGGRIFKGTSVYCWPTIFLLYTHLMTERCACRRSHGGLVVPHGGELPHGRLSSFGT